MIQFLAKDASAREFAALDGQLAGITASEQQAARAMADFEAAQGAAGQTADVVFQRIQDDVRTATADFKAGIISVEDYQVALQQARKEAIAQRKGTQLGGKELAQFSGIMDNTATRTQGAARSSRALTTGLVSLTAQATGASGALGGVARVALAMGTGGLVAGALAAGVAAATALYEHWTAAAKETKKAHDDLYASIEEAAKNLIPREIQIEQQRADLAREGIELTRRRLTMETALNFERKQFIQDRVAIASLEAELERLQQVAVDRLVKVAQLRRIGGNESTKAFEKHRDELTLEHQLLGRSEEAQYRLRLAAEKLTAAQIEQLIHLRQLNDERARAIQLAEMAELGVETGAIVAARGRARAASPPQLRGARPEGATPATAAPAPDGTPSIREGWAQADEELAHFGDTLKEVIKSGTDFEAAFTSAFEALEAGQNVAASFGKAIADGVALAAAKKGAFYMAQAIADLGDAFLGHPGALAAAAKHAAAGALFYGIAGAVRGAAHAVGAVAHGGGPGSAGGASEREASRRAAQNANDRGELRVVLKGSAAVLARDPEFVQSVADAFRDADRSSRIVVEASSINWSGQEPLTR
jgi:hypothetical protein